MGYGAALNTHDEPARVLRPGLRPNFEVYAITDGDDFYDIFTSPGEARHYMDDVAKDIGIPKGRLWVEMLIANPEPTGDSGADLLAKLAELETLVESMAKKGGSIREFR